MWADPVSKDVAQVFQAWAVLEAQHGTIQLARELFKCAVKANPQSEISWAVCVATSSHSVSSSQKVCYDELVNMFLPGLVMINAICQLSMFYTLCVVPCFHFRRQAIDERHTEKASSTASFC